jgi:hypothetical protein
MSRNPHIERPTKGLNGQTWCACGAPWPCQRKEDTVTEQPITRDLNPSGEALTVAVRMIVEPTGIRYTASASAGDHGVVGGGPGYWAEGPTPEVALYELERVVRRHQNLPVSE